MAVAPLRPGAWAALLLLNGLVATQAAHGGPKDGIVTSGTGRIAQNGATTTITQQSPRLAIEWSAFSVGAGEAVRFVQPGSGAIALNRVTGREPSAILGELSANGTVFLLNPNGVLFGAGARVEVGSLVASTLQLGNADFEAGRFHLAGDSVASVVNRGTLQAGSGGKLALVAARVENAGTMNAPAGNVLLAGASALSLTLADGSPLGYTISRGAAQALVENGGLIAADGGHVVLTARGMEGLAESVVNSSGVVQARTVRHHRGTIELVGDPATGIARMEGRIDASAQAPGETGGTVRVLADKVGVFGAAQVDASGPGGGGQVLIGGSFQGAGPSPNASAAYVAPTARIDASATSRGPGGEVVVWGTDVANAHGRLRAAGGPQGGAGGRVETSGHALNTDGIDVNVSGPGGLWLLDPYNVVISSGTQTGGGFSGGVWTPTGTGSLVNVGSIESILNSGSDVTIRTVGAGAQEGNISINGNIAKTAGGPATLSLIADGRITTDATAGTHRTITSTSGALNVSMSASATTTAAGNSAVRLSFVDISANGGDITVTATGAPSATAPAVDISNSVWTTAGAGGISLTGTLSGSSNSRGVWLRSNAFSTASGPISIAGTSGGTATVTGTNANGALLFSTGNIGVYLNGNNALTSSAGGAITLTGTATGNVATWSGSAVTLGELDTLSTSGPLTISGTASNPAASSYRNQQSTVALIGGGTNAVQLTGGSVTITGNNLTVGGASSTSHSNAAVKLDGKVNITATSGALQISGSNAGGDGVWGSGTAAVRLSAPATTPIQITARSLDSISGYSGLYIGGPATLSVLTNSPLQITAESQVAARRAFWNKGGLIVPGALSITSTAGMIADDTAFGGYFHVGGPASITASGAGNTVSLVNAGNAFAGGLSVSAADTTLFNSTALTLGASAVSGALTVTAPGIAQTGAITVSGATALHAGTSAITLGNSGNAFGGAIGITGGATTLAAAAPLTLGASTVTGALTVDAPGVSQSGALAVSGATTITSGTSPITLTDSANVFGAAVSLNGGDAAIQSSLPLTFALSALSGHLVATAPGIVQSGAVSIAGTSTLSSGASAIMLADGGNVFGGAVSLASGDATIVAQAPLTFGASTLSGALSATAPGIQQSGTLSVAGPSGFATGAATLLLADASNTFGGALSFATGDATINAQTPLTFAPSAAGGSLTVNALNIQQTGALSVGGAATLNSGGSDITLTRLDNVFSGPVALMARNASVAAGGPLVLGASSVSGDLDVVAAGLSQLGALTVGGVATLDGGGGAVLLRDSLNALSTLRVVGAADLAVVNGQAMTVSGVSAGGATSLTTLAGDLTASGVWQVTGGDLTLSAGAARARGDAAGGDVHSTATLVLDPGRVVTVYSGSLDGTGLAGSLAERATSGSGNFRYGRQAGDAPGAAGVGDGTTFVMYRERPVLTVSPIDAVNTKVYDGGQTNPDIAYTVTGLRQGDTTAMALTGRLTRAPGEDSGSHAIQPGSLADRLGYAVALAPDHSYVITPAPLLISVQDAVRLIGQRNPAFSVTYAGLVAGQSAESSGLSGSLRFITSATPSAPPGRYEVQAQGLTSRNYELRYEAGVLTVLPASAGGVGTGSEESASRYLSALADVFWASRVMGWVPTQRALPAKGTGGRWWTDVVWVETRTPMAHRVR